MPTGLPSWIQAQHLSEPALLQFRNSFQRHRARLVILKDFLQESIALRLFEFLKQEADFAIAHGLYSAEDQAIDDTAWSRADENDKFFRFSKLVGVMPKHALSPNALTYLRFRQSFQSHDVRNYFSQLCGFSLGWSDSFGCHSMKAGDFLKLHDDNGRNRKLALVFYLTPGWQSCFGGALTVVSADGHETRIEAEYNSMVAFDVTAGSKHFIEAITPRAGSAARLTISGWYLKDGSECAELPYPSAE